MAMDRKTVRKMERELEEAIGDVVVRPGRKSLPLMPTQQTIHFMSKAAVAVYEAAVDNQREPE
jgi:hypothetical protein